MSTPKRDDTETISIPAEGRTLSVGVNLKESELALYEQLARDLGVARTALMRYALRFFLREVLAGRVDVQKDVYTPERRNKLRMP